jgi:predicted Fe-Mo cluster-binding NifX family protein
MKIAISATGKTSKNLVDMRFGRCEFFQIHDTESGEFKILENEGQNSSGGAGIVASNQLLEEKVDVIITGSLGPNAFEIIEKAGIKAYKCGNMVISSVLDIYHKGELTEIKMAGPAHHGAAH